MVRLRRRPTVSIRLDRASARDRKSCQERELAAFLQFAQKGSSLLYYSFMTLALEVFSWVHRPLVSGRKSLIFGDLRGLVLELGAGTGVNFSYLHPTVEWIGLEPEPRLRSFCDRRLRRLGRKGRWVESLEELPDASLDAVMCSLVLCSVADLEGTLGHILRVLRPGGHFAFVEHVGAPRGSRTACWQSRLRRGWAVAAGGCQLCRETGAAIERVFSPGVQIEAFTLPLLVLGPHIAGVARKSHPDDLGRAGN